MWWPMPLIPAPERQTTEVDLDEFKASVVYITSYKPARATVKSHLRKKKRQATRFHSIKQQRRRREEEGKRTLCSHLRSVKQSRALVVLDLKTVKH